MLKRLSLALLVPSVLLAQSPIAPIPPVVNDPDLRIELIATVPEVEACATVCGDLEGAVYVGSDPRDGHLNTKEPVCNILRYAGAGSNRKHTVFADKLYSPAGSAWFDGWLYVIHDPYLTRFKDTNGDGVADVREDLITNLGVMPQDTGLNDHCASGFTLGMDGCWYISIGDRGSYQTKSLKDGSTVSLQGGGIIRCHVDGTKLEIFSSGTRNHLQVNLDAEDNAFTRDNTDDGNGWWTRLTHHIEGGYYGYPFDYRAAPNYGVVKPSQQTLDAIKQHGGTTEAQPNQPLQFLPAMADFGGGSPTGGLCYLSDGLPEKYRGKQMFSEWGKAGLYVTELARDGATFKLVSDTKLVEPAKGGEFRPMQVSVAVDGSLLIADWGYGGWKSPRIAGAVWRLCWPEAKPAPRLKDESKAGVDELITALGHPDRDQRLRAQFALSKLDVGTGKRLSALVSDEAQSANARMHAVWALEGIAEAHLTKGTFHSEPNVVADRFTVESAALAGALGDLIRRADAADGTKPAGPSSVRVQSARALGKLGRAAEPLRVLSGSLSDLIWQEQALEDALKDSEPSVRLQAATSLYFLGDNMPFTKLLDGLADPDQWIRFAHGSLIAKEASLAKGISLGEFQVMIDTANSAQKAWSGYLTVPEEYVWPLLSRIYEPKITGILSELAIRRESPAVRSHAASAIGNLAYQPKPWDGKWWGTQPVKNPPPPNSVAWVGTPKALEALAAALTDKDKDVRLSAAQAFTRFTLDDSGKAAATVLRTRLKDETEPAVRRQLIESLGVQKDPQAMDVFRQIALDEKADQDFRDTAIGAVVNIGGDAAKKTIAQLASAKLSQSATRKVIESAGDLKVLEAAPAIIAHLKDENVGNREAAAKSLRQLGPKSNSSPALIEALADKEGKVQVAAIEALGSLRDKAALPALIALAEKRKFHRESIQAIANMADESAVPVLAEAVREKDTGLRRSALKALKPFRTQATPIIEQMLASNRIPEELVPEVRNFFVSGAVTKWKMIGVFENVWEAVHPPEKEALEKGGVPDLTKKYHDAEGKDSAWRDVVAEAGSGEVDLQKLFNTGAMVCAYAFTEIDTPEAASAKILAGVDDELGIWLNGKSIFNQAGNHGYEADQNEIAIQLPAGKNALLVKIGNKGGGWIFNLRIPGFEDGKFIKSKEPTSEEKQRAFVLAAKPDGTWLNAGNAQKGEKLFFDPAAGLGAICSTCHAVKGKGGQVGPDLSTVGANYKRPDLLVSIFEPSKTIALGFEQVMVETNAGDIVSGSLRSETGDSLNIVDATGQAKAVKKTDIKKKTDLHVSLMPPGLTQGLKPQEFADLVAYLESLK